MSRDSPKGNFLASIAQVYSQYGFKQVSSGSVDCAVFTFQSGYFWHAEVVARPGVDTGKVEEQFKAAGYACKVTRPRSAGEAELLLYRGFFAIDNTRADARREYRRYCDRTAAAAGLSKYEYIASPFELDGVVGDGGDLVSALERELDKGGPRLILVEAAAGFGKTTSVYELVFRYASRSDDRLALLTELSRNRQARIFRYVLLDEIDRQFPRLPLDLVLTQVKQGRIVLIVDGFDELLRTRDADADRFEDAEPMLQTISEILSEQAKVVLTTRRAAIFSGDQFHEWLSSKHGQFSVSRVVIQRPSAPEWIGYERHGSLVERGVDLDEIANPVLLSFLRGVARNEFDRLCEEPDRVLDEYFAAMLQRENARQDLRMGPVEQRAILGEIAAYFVAHDVTAERRSDLSTLIATVAEPLIAQARERYQATERPSAEEIVSKLLMHALLDRRGRDEQLLGFVNDFVLGVFVGDVACAANDPEWVCSELFCDLAVTAGKARGGTQRADLATALNFVVECQDASRQLACDLALHRRLYRSYRDGTFEAAVFRKVRFAAPGKFTACVFTRSRFIECVFDPGIFTSTAFVGCEFVACHLGDGAGAATDGYVAGCTGSKAVQKALGEGSDEEPVVDGDDVGREFERAVLLRFWPAGRAYFTGQRELRTLRLGIPEHSIHHMEAAIDALEKRGIVMVRGQKATLNREKIGEITRLLGRDR